MSDDIILGITKLNLVFRLDLHRSMSWKAAFARAVSNPLSALTAERDRFHVLKDISFQVRKGERVGILGVNGAGKTSLCRCIAGIFRPTTGSISINKPVRAVFNTQVGIKPELTGRENAELLAQFVYPDESNHSELINEALEFSELGNFIDIPFQNYSNGMQTRLCLSLISAKPAHLLILDEVYDGADAFFKEKVSKRVLKLIEESGAVLFVSHDAEQIRRVCTRTIILNHNQIVFDGLPQDGLAFFQTLKPIQS